MKFDVCPNCGTPLLRVLGSATASKILAIIGFFTTCLCIGIFFDLAAILCGIYALDKIRISKGTYVGKNRAKTGIILGSIMIVLAILLIAFGIPGLRVAAVRGRSSRAMRYMYDISAALEKYHKENHSYPLPDYDANGRPVLPHALTTPIAYLVPSPYVRVVKVSRLFHDPFQLGTNKYFGYGVDTAQGYIIVSYGPDKVDGNSGVVGGSKMPYMKAWSDEAIGFNLQASPLTYDPSNGTYSAGDIWRRGP